MIHRLIFLVLCLTVTPCIWAEDDFPRAHEKRMIAGWTVQVDSRLLTEPEATLGKQAIALLRARLVDIVTVVPEDKVALLRKVTLWLDLNHGKLTSMQYHPSAEWLEKNGYSTELANSVHIPVATSFVEARHQQTQPWCVMHELAHAYHHQVLGYEDARILEHWHLYVDSGHGLRVLHVNGRSLRHYALSNDKEYFAEMTEAYFGTNDFSPFVHGQLKHDEPETYTLLREIWGKTVFE